MIEKEAKFVPYLVAFLQIINAPQNVLFPHLFFVRYFREHVQVLVQSPLDQMTR